ncbi:hypothetical protein PG985_005634 [Apiospora marii]|uniref:uncharacterized protein n=1 Tax=Apiospora marii TaxID=335849 RepID=UPI00312DC064
MRFLDVLVSLAAVGSATATPLRSRGLHYRQATTNPRDGKKLFADPAWSEKLNATHDSFVSQGDTTNAAKVRSIQDIGSFVWVSNIASLPNIDAAIESARAAQKATGTPQMVGLVLYNLPDRDCSAGESAGELVSSKGGLQRYKTEFLSPWAEKLGAASDLTFAVVLEPDSLANIVTGLSNKKCAAAQDVYKQGIAAAIKNLQFKHVHLYIDAANGGWLGDANQAPGRRAPSPLIAESARLTPNSITAAKVFGEVVRMAGNSRMIRGFSTNISNFNPFKATVKDSFAESSDSFDESHYTSSLAPYLEAQGLPTRFIVDQGRVAQPGARAKWGDWCNVTPAGFGMRPGTKVDNPLIDSIAWIKPGGESDGQCGMAGAPIAGAWFDKYAQMLVKNADASV